MFGCCDARASRKPEVASSATPQPVAAAPASTASEQLAAHRPGQPQQPQQRAGRRGAAAGPAAGSTAATLGQRHAGRWATQVTASGGLGAAAWRSAAGRSWPWSRVITRLAGPAQPRAVADQDDGAAGRQGLDGLRQSLAGRWPGPGGRRARRAAAAARPAGTRGPARSAAADPPTAAARARRARCRSRAGRSSMNSAAPASPAARRIASAAGAGLPERDVVGHGAGEQVRLLRHPGDLGAPPAQRRSRPGRCRRPRSSRRSGSDEPRAAAPAACSCPPRSARSA